MLQLFTEHLGGAEDALLRTVGDSLYVRYANDPAVLKITAQRGSADETRVTLQLIHPDHGPIDSGRFTQTRSQDSLTALKQLDAYLDIWFV
ncbi:hypothetical protein [Streptomyces sp. NPDC059787]|uniref:hypothetical protein n=1 Tax=Streptomyces sp. NPDC059787 TaxID=3346947 RepID=UPI0036477FE8